jgi:hypothetical protein
MRAWMFVALVCGACKASGDDGSADAAPMGHPTYESQYCSRDLTESPLYTCSPQYERLVCISTYEAAVDGGATAPVFVCRFSCMPDPCTGSDVCCPGTGINGQTIHACVPANACASMRAP